MGGARGTYGREERCKQSLVRNPWEKRSLGRLLHKWKDNIKNNFQ
jgi:hypothetical protein